VARTSQHARSSTMTARSTYQLPPASLDRGSVTGPFRGDPVGFGPISVISGWIDRTYAALLSSYASRVVNRTWSELSRPYATISLQA
jgi:hypothetical protein